MRYPISETRSYCKAKLHTGEVVEAPSRANLAIKVFNRLKALNALPDNLTAYLADAICSAMPAEQAARECRYVDEDAPEELRKDRVLRLDDVWRFLRAMKAWLLAGGGLDSQVEATRRANICSSCPHNIDLAGCSWCSGVLSAALDLLAGRTTPLDDQLKHCDVCGCNNRAAVHFPLSTVDTRLEYPSWCWKREAIGTPPDTASPVSAAQDSAAPHQ